MVSDYISRDAANEACREAVRRYPNSFYNGIEAARDAIRKLPAADVRPRWVPVTERLPKKMQYVLVRYKNNDMAVASWFGGDEHIRFWRAMTDEGWCADCDTEPTHWMPLPPPEEE